MSVIVASYVQVRSSCCRSHVEMNKSVNCLYLVTYNCALSDTPKHTLVVVASHSYICHFFLSLVFICLFSFLPEWLWSVLSFLWLPQFSSSVIKSFLQPFQLLVDFLSSCLLFLLFLFVSTQLFQLCDSSTVWDKTNCLYFSAFRTTSSSLLCLGRLWDRDY